MRRGFTLVELMLVVIIIGILVGMVVPRLTGRSQEARVAAAKADIHSNLALALDLYELDNGKYPEGLNDLCKSDKGKGPYLKKCSVKDPWGNPYQYNADNQKGTYKLWSFGPDGQDNGGSGDDISSEEKEATK